MKIHVLQCGSICVDPTVPYGKRLNLIESAKQLTAADKSRITLPVFTYLIEHPKGLILVDTGWCREISPRGVYDSKAAAAVLPSHLAAFFHPVLPMGMAVHEQLAAMGIQPEDLECVLLTHLDPDHVSGLRHVYRAKHVILPEDEYFWSCRTVYKTRQPQNLWIQYPMERPYYRGSALGPNHWVIDLFGDKSIQLVNVPGHTDGQAAIVIRKGGRFVLLTADAAFSPRNWQDMIVPGFGFAREWQRKSLRWIADMAADPNCAAVLCSHDPDVKPGVIAI
ncbi:MAG: N-acyl homoserine lactonase family protein [Oscillospiraceae bacterium]|nr:N-acyl homoserine lactonase family protein [Oscillospiraceae bacterium]